MGRTGSELPVVELSTRAPQLSTRAPLKVSRGMAGFT